MNDCIFCKIIDGSIPSSAQGAYLLRGRDYRG